MTICIAAICEDGNYIVVSADRMFTSPLNVEFETDEKKIEVLSKSCVALAAGGSAQATEVLEPIRQKFSGKNDALVPEITVEVLNSYKYVRAMKVEENYLAMLGNDFLEQRKKGTTLPMYLQSQQGMYQQIVGLSSQLNLNLDLLVSGIDSSGAHLEQITHPGTHFPLEKLGYAAVGSGGSHAVISLSLSGQTKHRELIATLQGVYDAKKAAEKAPGVGLTTDMAVIDKNGIWDCPPELCAELEKVNSEVQKKASPDLKKVRETYENLRKPK